MPGPNKESNAPNTGALFNNQIHLLLAQESREIQLRAHAAQSTVPELSNVSIGKYWQEAADRNDAERWRYPPAQEAISPEHLQKLRSCCFPQHSLIHPESIGKITFHPVPSYPELDAVTEAICSSVTTLLSRRLDAYRFVYDEFVEHVTVPELGTLEVKITQAGNGIFSYLSEIRGDGFVIFNSRESGRRYRNDLNEIARPSIVSLETVGLDIQLSSDSRPPTATEHGIVTSNHRDVSSKITKWLQDKVLSPLKTAPVPEYQETTLPAAKPYLAEYGPLYVWLKSIDAQKLFSTLGDARKLEVDERAIISPNKVLIPSNYEDPDIPALAYRRFSYLGIGEIDSTSVTTGKYLIPDAELDGDPADLRQQLVQVIPEHVEGLYVIDRSEFHKVLQAHSPGELTPDRSIRELIREKRLNAYRALARTLVPLDTYKGGYLSPLVLCSRTFEMHELKIVEGVVYDPKQ